MKKREKVFICCLLSAVILLGAGCRGVSQASGHTNPTVSEATDAATEISTEPTVPPITVSTEPTIPPTTVPTEPTVPPTAVPTEPTVPPTTAPTEPTVPPTTVPTEPTVPPTMVPTEPTVPPTMVPTEPTVPPTTAPTEPTIPPTTAAEDPSELIGSLYTRGQLMQLDNTHRDYSCGYSKNGLPPNGAVSAQKQYGEYDAWFYMPDSKGIFLTFDCGYEPILTDENGSSVRYTERILDILLEKNVKAAFFLNLQFCKTAPDLVQRMIDEGHIVGNHTAYHIMLPDCSIDRCVSDILYLQNYIQEHFGYTMTLFRPSSGVYSQRGLALVQSLGFTTVNWSVAYADWDPEKQPPVAQSKEKMISGAHPGAIYLYHSLSATTASFMGEFIDTLRAQGYEFTVIASQ